MTKRTWGGFLMASLCLGLSVISGSGMELISQGKSDAKIYIPVEAEQDIHDAANELSNVLFEMTAVRLPVEPAADAKAIPKDVPAVLLGSLAESAGLKMEKKSLAKDGFRYAVKENHLLIVGESARGVYYGAYRFMESLGCGWYATGKLGEVIPKSPVVKLADDLDFSEVSDSVNRRVWYGGKGDWPDLVTWRRKNGGDADRGSWSHAWHGLVNPDTHFAEHPEYFGMKRGQRAKSQLCTTHPETIRLAAEALMSTMATKDLTVYAAGPNDGGGLCECAECAKQDTPEYFEYSSGKPACGDRIFMFANELAKITSKKYPDKGLGILVYSEYSRIPVKLKQLHPNVFPMIAPIRRCRIHGPGNPICEMGKLLAEEIQGWSKISNGKMGFYPYNYHLADAMVPFSKIGYYKDLQREIQTAGIKELAWIPETMDAWSTYAPTIYLSVRMTWNSSINIDAEMERFFNGFYGEAAAPMKSYWMRIDQAYVTTDMHTGSQYGLHKVWTDELLKASRADIEAARKLVQTPRVKEAVDMAEAGLVCAEQFIRIHKATVAFDFLGASKTAKELEAYITARDEKNKPDAPRWFHNRYSWGYYARFSGNTVTGGAKIFEDGGQIVVKFPDAWKFSKDEKVAGVTEGWFKPDYNDSTWSNMPTFSSSWVDEGLTWYQGDAWYRTTFQMPKDAKDSDLRIWFGGFDNNVDVYINGQGIGELKGFAKPGEIPDIAKHLKFGEDNVLAVRVSAGGLAEIGTGGIMKPVMIYKAVAKTPEAPKDDAKKKGVEYEM